MTTGKYPFDGGKNYINIAWVILLSISLSFSDTVFLLFENIAKGEFVIPDNVDSQLSSLLKGMLQVDQNLRFSIQNIKEHPYVTRK